MSPTWFPDTSSRYEFLSPAQILGGRGSVREAAGILRKRLGIEPGAILVVGDDAVLANGLAEPLLAALHSSGLDPIVTGGLGAEPSSELIDATASRARSLDAQAVVGIGGGSVLDSSKILALLLALSAATGVEAEALREREGLGAAGGLALGLVSIFGAQLVPGAQLVSEAIGLRGALRGAAFVITGEGRLDAQSLRGKVVSRVLEDAGDATPVFVVAGSVELTAAECRSVGISAAFSIARGAAELSELRAGAPQLLFEAAAGLSGALAARMGV